MASPEDFHVSGSLSIYSAVGLFVIGADLLILRLNLQEISLFLEYGVRAAVALAALFLLLLSRRASPSDFGLTMTGWRGDVRLMSRMGVIVLGVYAALVSALVISIRSGWIDMDLVERHRDFRDMAEFRSFVLSALVCAPIVEELVYRGFAIPALAAGFGRRGAIFLSGPVFYLLHLAYGKPPELVHYTIAGWILAWAYVRTGRLWVPIALHALGNLLMGFDDAVFLWAPDVAKSILGQ